MPVSYSYLSKTMKSSKNICVYGIMLLLTFATAASSWADENKSSPWKKFSVDFGFFYPIFNTEVRLDSKTLGRGTDIDGEDDLNLKTELSLFRAEAQWRFFPKHRLEFTYYDISRDASVFLGRTLQFGDRTFTIGTTIRSDTNIQIFKIAYTWSFLQTQDYELGISLGADLMDIETSISAPIIGDESEALIAPLPVLGLRAAYAFSPNFVLNTSADFFYLEYEEFKGRLLDVNFNLEYYFLEYLSLSIGYNFFDVEVTYESDRRDLDFGYLFHGPKAAVKIYF